MPNLLAHSLLVKRLYNNEVEKSSIEKKSFLVGNYDFLVLGSLGPDPLFYTGILPSHGLHLLTASKKVGNKLHKLDGKKLFKRMVEQVYFIENDKERNRYCAFVLGQFAHYLLDRISHPYILYESGFDENGRITSHYHHDHAYFETKLDCALAKRYTLSHFLSDPEDVIPDNPRNLALIDSYFVPAIEQVLEIKKIAKKTYSNGILNMRKLLKKFSHSPKRSKLYPKSISLSGMCFPSEIDLSVLNEEKKEWLDPVTGEKHEESFLELHSAAYELLKELYHDLMTRGFNYDTFQKYIDGKDYYGSLPGSKRQYHR